MHHSSPIYVKRNILASTFIPHPWLSQQDFSRFVLDFLVFGNAFLEKRYSTTGKVIRLETSPAKYTRRGVEEDVYWWVPSFNEPTAFAPGSVFHLLEPDINQELYGLPEYLSALNSAAEWSRPRCSAASITKTALMPDTSCTSPMPCRIATISKCFAKTWLSRRPQ